MDPAFHEITHGGVDHTMSLDQWLVLEFGRDDEGCEMAIPLGRGLGMTGMEVRIVPQLQVRGRQAFGNALAQYVGGRHGHVRQ